MVMTTLGASDIKQRGTAGGFLLKNDYWRPLSLPLYQVVCNTNYTQLYMGNIGIMKDQDLEMIKNINNINK